MGWFASGRRLCFASMLVLLGNSRGAAPHLVLPWNLPPAAPGRLPSCRALDKQQQVEEQRELAEEEWGLRVPWSGRGRQPSLHASDYRGWEGGCLPAPRPRTSAEGLEIGRPSRSLTGPSTLLQMKGLHSRGSWLGRVLSCAHFLEERFPAEASADVELGRCFPASLAMI